MKFIEHLITTYILMHRIILKKKKKSIIFFTWDIINIRISCVRSVNVDSMEID